MGPSEEKQLEASDTHVDSDDDELLDLVADIHPLDDQQLAAAIRPDILDKAFQTLSADAQRGDGSLKRADINRTYLRRKLSVAECMQVEERIISAGFRIIDDEDESRGFDVEKNTGTGRRWRTKYLNENEERQLARKIQLAIRLPTNLSAGSSAYATRITQEALQAKEAFVISNIRWVEKLARRYAQTVHLSFEDLFQEGVLGLLRATELYDPERGFRFKTYATWWIEQKMDRAIADGERTVRLPVHLQERIRRIKKSEKRLALELGKTPTTNELAIAIGMTPERLMKILWLVHVTDCAEGDAPIGEDETRFGLVADQAASAFDLIADEEQRARVSETLATLSPREERVVRLRFGIGTEAEHTLESVGQQYNVTRERIRQIEAKALRKLRHPVRRKRLRDLIDI